MANGFHGSESEWQRLETPLQPLDERMLAFANRHGMTFDRGRRWPDRSLEWWGDSIRRYIQIYVKNEAALTYNMWLCASEDRGRDRYWKQEFLKDGVPASEIDEQLDDLLDHARTLLESWDSNSLEFAIQISLPDSGA
jgi:hypothetical protein